MQFSCLTCSARYNIADEKVREKTVKIRCKSCRDTILLEWPVGASEPKPAVMVGQPQITEAPAKPPAPAIPHPNPSPTEQERGLTESEDDLIAVLRRASELLQRQEYDQRRALLRGLIFHDDAWFIKTFGEELGRHYWRQYRASRESLFKQLQEITDTADLTLRVEEIEPSNASLTQKLLLEVMQAPHQLATLHLTVKEGSMPMRSWVQVDNAWRLLGEPLFLLAYSSPPSSSGLPPSVIFGQTSLRVRPGDPSGSEEGPDGSPGSLTRPEDDGGVGTTEGLLTQLRELFTLYKKEDPSPLREALARCRVDEGFFKEQFGETRGAKMAKTYASLWPFAVAQLLVLLSINDVPELEAEVREDAASIAHSFELTHLPPPKVPLAVVIANQLPLLYWVHRDGSWRYTLFLPVLAELPATSSGLRDAMKQLQLLSSSYLLVERHYVLASLELPDVAQWTAQHFTPAVAAALTSEYQQTIKEGALQEIGQNIVEKKKASIEANCQANPYSQEISGYQRQLLLLAKRPFAVGRVDFGGYQYFSFVYVDGAWRWLGKTRAVGIIEAPAVIDPSTEAYGESASELERFLIDTHRHLLSLEGNPEAFISALESAIKRTLLPSPQDWFAKSFAPELAVKLGKEYSSAPSRAEQISSERSVDPLGVGKLSKRLATRTERLLLSGWESRITAGHLDAHIESAGEHQAVVSALYTGAAPLYWTSHRGPEGSTQSGAWVYADGHWRHVGIMSKVTMTPEWMAVYGSLFPGTEVGLRDLFMALVRSFMSSQIWFGLLTESLRPAVASIDWFRGLGRVVTFTPLEGVEKYDAGRLKEIAELIAFCMMVDDADDVSIKVIPFEDSGLYGVNLSNLRSGSATVFVFLRFCDGAWRWLGGAINHR